MTDFRCNSGSRHIPARVRPGAICRILALIILGGACAAPPVLALSGEPTPLGIPDPAVTPAPDTLPTQAPPPGGGIEAAPLPPQPGSTPTVTNPDQPAPPQGLPVPTEPGQAAPAVPVPEGSIAGQPTGSPAMPAAGSLGPDLWQGSEVSRLMGLLPRLPAPVTVPGLRYLQLRVLTTQAASAGATDGLDPLQPLRADKLHQMGFNEAALSLSQSGVVSAATDPLEVVSHALQANDNATACQQVDQVLAGNQALDPFFRRAIIYCQIVRGQNDAASLGLGLLRESGSEDRLTKDFVALAALANNETKRVPKSVVEPDQINLALMRMVGMKLPGAEASAVAVPTGPGGALTIARDAARPLPERAAAAEQAFRYGLLPASELGQLYLQIPAGNADPVTAIGLADTLELRAQLYQAAERTSQPAMRARAIDAALKKARQRGDYLNQAELYGRFADGIAPGHDLAWFAPEAARLMFLAGKADRGGYWLNTVAANPGVFARPGEREGVELLGRIAGLGGQGDPVADWRQASGTTNARIDLLYALLSGVGAPVASGVAGSFPADPVVAPGSASAEIAAAAAGKRRGEALVLALAAIGGDQAIAADPAALATALRSLAAIGHAAEARRIASEIAVLAGL